jgi:hypothetical protein
MFCRHRSRIESRYRAWVAVATIALAPLATATSAASDLDVLRERATTIAAQNVAAYWVDDARIGLFAERAVIAVDDAGSIVRAKYEALAACAVKSWQAAEPAVEREMLESVVSGRLVRTDAMGYRGALAERLTAAGKLDSDGLVALEDASLAIYLPCEGAVDQHFQLQLAEAQEKTRQLLRSTN